MDNYDLFRELGIAMNRNPDLTILEVLDLVLDRQFPTRTITMFYDYRNPSPAWTPTNSDILTALRKYNEG